MISLIAIWLTHTLLLEHSGKKIQASCQVYGHKTFSLEKKIKTKFIWEIQMGMKN